MPEQTSVARWLAIGLVAVGVVGGVWLAVGSSRDSEVSGEAPDPPASRQEAVGTEPAPNPARMPAPIPAPMPEEPATPPAPDYHIEANGRLSIDARSLPAGAVVTFGLALDDEALGEQRDPLSAVVVSADDGRRLELSATPAAGLESGVRLEVDSAWLEPGVYMIQIRTAEKSALPLRRYVLNVAAAPAPEPRTEVPEDAR